MTTQQLGSDFDLRSITDQEAHEMASLAERSLMRISDPGLFEKIVKRVARRDEFSDWLCIKHKGRVVGLAGMSWADSPTNGRLEGRIDGIFIDEGHSDRELIRTSLFEVLFETARENNITHIKWVTADPTVGVICEGMGFTIAQEEVVLYKDIPLQLDDDDESDRFDDRLDDDDYGFE